MEQKSGAWLLCCCVCVCVSLWAKSNETKIPDQNGKNQPRKVCCVPNVWECVCVFKCVCVCVWVRERERETMAESDGEKGFWGASKHSPAAATQSSTPGRMLNPVLVWVPTSGPRAATWYSLFLTLKCAENDDTDEQVSKKLSVSNVGTEWTNCHNRKLHLVNKNEPFYMRSSLDLM